MSGGLERTDIKNMDWDKPNVFTIAIFPNGVTSLCDHTLKILVYVSNLGRKFNLNKSFESVVNHTPNKRSGPSEYFKPVTDYENIEFV